ncbi:hypothetical protein B0H11DRAFT_234397 [Mycena galericulata]|nr:hypothetical protein B0H11DRAFT_234397 [Mycena galericulata]
MAKRRRQKKPRNDLEGLGSTEGVENRVELLGAKMNSQSFILALPVEITAEIFLNCLPLPQEATVYGDLQTHIFTGAHPISMVLCQICRSWRAISLDTPDLWSTLYLNLDAYPIELLFPEKFNQDVDGWIRRARLLPLSMIIRATQDGPYEAYSCLLNALIPRYADRLRTLKFFSDEEMYSGLQWDGPFPLLQQILLHFEVPPSYNYEPIELFREAPQLREVHLKAYAVDSFFILPCHHLTSFTGEISSMDIFQLAPGLVEAVVSLTMEEPGFVHRSDAIIMHPNLRSFAFSCRERAQGSASIEALQFLTLPALERLHIYQTNTRDHDTHATFSSFLSRSSPPLRILSMSISDMPPTWETQFATTLRTLERLRLTQSYKSSVVQERLLAWLEVDAQNHLPELLELVFSTSNTRQHAHLLHSISHRSPGPSKARAIRVICEGTTQVYLSEHDYILPGFSFSGTGWVIVNPWQERSKRKKKRKKPLLQNGLTPGISSGS